jgi:hypothetical protein
LQQLNLMTDPFVLSRVKMAASPALQEMARLPDDALIEQLFLSFLSRRPTASELALAQARLRNATGAVRNAAIEDLAWVAINKLDFLFRY